MQRLNAILLLALVGALAPIQGRSQTIETYAFTNKMLAPDGNSAGLTDVRSLNSAIGAISSVTVGLQVSGEFNGDLYVSLRHSRGFTVLLNRPGKTAANAFGYADSGLDVTLQTGATNGDAHVYQSIVTPADGSPLTGAWEPDGRDVDPANATDASPRAALLTNFTGLNAAGEWTLYVADMDSGATNMLTQWSLEIAGSALPTTAWTTPSDINYGTALSQTQMNATVNCHGTNVPGTLTYAPPLGTVLNAGSNQTLSVTFTPADATRFLPLITNVTINVLAAPLTITAVSHSKTYDGTISAIATPVITSGTLKGNDTAYFWETYDTKDVGTNKTITPAVRISDGNGGQNYSVTYVANTNGIVRQRLITVGAVGNAKTYDGTTVAAATPVITEGSLQATDTGNFSEHYDNKNAGGGKTLTPSGTVNDGNNGNDYSYYFLSGAQGVISAKGLTVTGVTAANKTYDGTTIATILTNGAALAGVITGDDARLGGSPSGAFASAAVGTGIAVSVSGLAVIGADAGNYVLTQPATTANILPQTLMVTADNKMKTWGFPNPPLTASVTGFVHGDFTNAVSGCPSLNTSATASSPEGSYPITISCGTLCATNYNFSYANGALSVVAPPQLAGKCIDQNELVLTCPTIEGETYQVLFNANLTTTNWVPVGPPILGTGSPLLLTNWIESSALGFFRLQVTP